MSGATCIISMNQSTVPAEFREPGIEEARPLTMLQLKLEEDRAVLVLLHDGAGLHILTPLSSDA